MTEDHGLGDGDGSIDITESLELLVSIITQNVVLFNGVQCLLLSLQFDDVGVRNNFLGKFPYRIFKGAQVEACGWSLPLNADALILMALGCYHHVSLIQDKHLHLLGVYKFQFGTPVQDSARSANYNLLRDLLTSLHYHICKFKLRMKLSHLLNYFSCLKRQLICWGKAQTLEGK
uniref:Uncharacterized protein n=1 Tax=Pelusios castaneus TaxID=367368 RepID=A0A8C8S8X0_9SAUR